MTWRIQSISEGPVYLHDVGLTFRKGDIRDLDLMGRGNAEQSNDIKFALQKGWVRELEKGPGPVGEGLDPALVEKLTVAADKADEAMQVQSVLIGKLEDSNERLHTQLKLQEERLKEQAEHNALMVDKADNVVEEVKRYFEKDPLGIRVIKEALTNIRVERGQITEERESMETSGASEAEIAARNRILNLRDKRLEKNATEIGKTISSDGDDLDIDESLDAMDDLGIV